MGMDTTFLLLNLNREGARVDERKSIQLALIQIIL